MARAMSAGSVALKIQPSITTTSGGRIVGDGHRRRKDGLDGGDTETLVEEGKT